MVKLTTPFNCAEHVAQRKAAPTGRHVRNIGLIALYLARYHTPGDFGDCSVNDPIVNIIDELRPADDFLRALAGMSEDTASGIVKQLGLVDMIREAEFDAAADAEAEYWATLAEREPGADDIVFSMRRTNGFFRSGCDLCGAAIDKNNIICESPRGLRACYECVSYPHEVDAHLRAQAASVEAQAADILRMVGRVRLPTPAQWAATVAEDKAFWDEVLYDERWEQDQIAFEEEFPTPDAA